MKWNNIEARWLEMARRALGDAGNAGSVTPVDPFSGPLPGPASADGGSVVASTVTAALAAVVPPDRSVA